MRIFNKDSIIYKIVISIVLVMFIFNIVLPVSSHAEFDWGGDVFEPVQLFVCALGDAIIIKLQDVFIEGAPKAVEKLSLSQLEGNDSSARELLYSFNVLGLHALAYPASVLESVTLGHPADLNNDGYVSGAELIQYYGTKQVLPQIIYGVENIFANQIPAFDVNFVNPTVTNPDTSSVVKETVKRKENVNYVKSIKNDQAAREKVLEVFDQKKKGILQQKGITQEDIDTKLPAELIGNGKLTEEEYKYITSFDLIVLEARWNELKDLVTMADDAGITLGKLSDSQNASIDPMANNIAYQLRDTVAKWYTNLRYIAIVGLMSILMYIGIRIVISSVGQEKAKYKTMFKDWVVAVCLLFFMHYLMVFILKIVEIVTDIIASSSFFSEPGSVIMNTARMNVTWAQDLGDRMGYTVIYAVLIFYTIIFTWQYLKRVIYMAFLTMIAPLVSLTYPIDKIKDGQAQAFSMWLREYIFNVALQPIHLLLFTILVSTAFDLASSNMIYSLVAIGFLLPAEKLIKQMFGFNKASGGALADGLVGGALFASALGLVQNGSSYLGAGGGSPGATDAKRDSKIHYTRTKDNGVSDDLAGFSSGGSGGFGPSGSRSGGRSRTTPGSGSGSGPTPGSGSGSGPTPGSRSGSRPTPRSSSRTGGSNPRSRTSRRRRSTGGGVRSAVSKLPPIRLGRGVGNVARRFVLNGNSAKKIGGSIVKAYAAATLGLIGFAGGLASDDLLNAAKYGGAGLAGGMVVGNAINNAAGKAVSTGGKVIDAFEEGYLGDDYYDKQNAKLDKEWANDKETIRYFKDKYGNKNYKKKMNMALGLRKYGITDQKEIDSAIKLIDKNQDITIEQVANIMQFKDSVTQDYLMERDKRDKVEARVHNLTQSDEGTAKVMNLLDQYFKVV